MKHIEIQPHILSTKLFIPPARSVLVSRPRLVARLNQGLMHPVTLVSAPAGFGKTTLVSEWRASESGRNYPLAWLSLDVDDNDPIRFLTYLVAALDTLKPGIAETAFSVLQSPKPPSHHIFLTGLINDLSEIVDPFALVLDDYHVIDSQQVHQALIFLLEHIPQQMHLILLTRSDPPLPLARLRARNQLAEFRVDDLRFTPEEAAIFFKQVMGLMLSADDVAALEHRTEGWITGLQLAALAIQKPSVMRNDGDTAEFIRSFTGSHHYIADFLSAEVLGHQPESVSTFLLQTSILERMTSELCDRLTGRRDSQLMLQQIDKANLFLFPLDEEQRWYRYHHLFVEMLRFQLRQNFPDLLAELHLRAAEWYEQHGFVSDAIRHFLAAGDMPSVARLVELNAMTMLLHGETKTVLDWITTIAPLIETHPWLGIYQCWALIITGHLEQLESILHGIEKRISSCDSICDTEEMYCHIDVIRALAAERQEKDQEAIELAHQALERLPESNNTIRSIIFLLLGDASWSIGDLTQAKEAFSEASRIEKAAGNLIITTGSLSSIGEILIEQGQLHQAMETFQSSMQTGINSDGRMMPITAPACFGLSSLKYEWNDLNTAQHYLEQAMELGRRWGNPPTLARIHLLQASIKQAQGDTAGSLMSLHEAEGMIQGQIIPLVTMERINAMHVRLWLSQGNIEAAERWVSQNALNSDNEITYKNQIAYLTLGRILIAQNKADKALSLFERLLVQFENNGQKGRSLELLILQSLTFKKRGDIPGALNVLTRALTLGESEKYMRVFLDEGTPMAELLRHAGSHGITPKYVAKLLSEFNTDIGISPDSQQPLIDPLTARELQVLRLMADGLSNQAIANRLVVAVGTIKTHTASLYRKLGVINRTEAVARATALGLF